MIFRRIPIFIILGFHAQIKGAILAAIILSSEEFYFFCVKPQSHISYHLKAKNAALIRAYKFMPATVH